MSDTTATGESPERDLWPPLSEAEAAAADKAITALLRRTLNHAEALARELREALGENTAPHLACTHDGELRRLRGRVAYLEADRQIVKAAVEREREQCAQLAEQEASQRGNIVAEDALRQFAARLRDGRPPPAKRDEIAQRAEEIHAEHHPGYIVPSLDSCTEHTRAEYEQMVADLLREAQP